MSSINSVRKLQMLCFSKKNKTMKKVALNPHLYILLIWEKKYPDRRARSVSGIIYFCF